VAGDVPVVAGAVTVVVGAVTVVAGAVTVVAGAVTVVAGAVTVVAGAVTVVAGAVTVWREPSLLSPEPSLLWREPSLLSPEPSLLSLDIILERDGLLSQWRSSRIDMCRRAGDDIQKVLEQDVDVLLSPEMSLLSSDIVLKEVMVRQVNYKLRHLDLETDTVHDSDSIPVPTRVFAICMWHVLEKKVGVVQLCQPFFFNLNNFFINFEVNRSIPSDLPIRCWVGQNA